MSQRIKFKITLYIALLVVLIMVLAWWFYYNSLKIDDYQRLGDMRVIESEMINYFAHFNTYEIPGCMANSLINFCTGAGDHRLAVGHLVDPVNEGAFQYVVAGLTNNDFAIDFALSVGAGGLPAGNYRLTKEGIE